ncbi:MAG: hypothetical protein JO286_19760 [Solirubrobacterales bacterium]|nr:hypothetical protein [Solirubrobacterales bacterium]
MSTKVEVRFSLVRDGVYEGHGPVADAARSGRAGAAGHCLGAAGSRVSHPVPL